MGVEGLPPFVFIRWPGGIISLGMLEGGSLGILAVFPYLGISRVVRSVVWTILFPGEYGTQGGSVPRDAGYVVLMYVGFYVTGLFSNCLGQFVSYHSNPLDI